MKEPWRSAMGDLLLLSFAAGCADAAGYIHFGSVFTCNMTGNVVLCGISLGEHRWWDSLRFVFVLGLFALGTGLGLTLTRHLDENDWRAIVRRVIGVETGLLFCFAIGWAFFYPLPPRGWSQLLLGSLTVAMGLQTSALYRFKAPGIQTTALTSTIATFVKTALQDVSSGQEERRLRSLFNAWVIGLYSLGAMVAGFSLFHFPRIVGMFPATLVWAVFLRHAGRKGPGSARR